MKTSSISDYRLHFPYSARVQSITQSGGLAAALKHSDLKRLRRNKRGAAMRRLVSRVLEPLRRRVWPRTSAQQRP